jgi:hypothetical protein
MARPKAIKNLSPIEIKAERKNILLALKEIDNALKPYQVAVTVAGKELASAKKVADKQLAVSNKVFESAQAKFTKAMAAADKGKAKLGEKLTALADAVEPALM